MIAAISASLHHERHGRAAAIAELDRVAGLDDRASACGARRPDRLARRAPHDQLVALIERRDLELVARAIEASCAPAHELGLVADDEVVLARRGRRRATCRDRTRARSSRRAATRSDRRGRRPRSRATRLRGAPSLAVTVSAVGRRHDVFARSGALRSATSQRFASAAPTSRSSSGRSMKPCVRLPRCPRRR